MHLLHARLHTENGEQRETIIRTFIYEIEHGRSRQDDHPLTRVYVHAFPSFSLRELSSKQVQILDRLTDPDCPLDCAMQIAFQTNMSVASLCIAKINHFDKIEKAISYSYLRSLEIVLFKAHMGKKIIKWLRSIWKGEWKKLSVVEQKK